MVRVSTVTVPDRWLVGPAILPSGPVDRVAIGIAAGRIVAVEPGEPWRAVGAGAAEAVDGIVLPGLVDTHVHGGGGADLATTDRAEARRAIAFHRAHGTTGLFASLVTAPVGVLCDQLRALGPLCATGELAGLHLEGPFLAAGKRGAHDPGLLIAPAAEVVDELLAAADGALSMITIAPELPGALSAIDRFVEAGVTVAIGHTEAGPEECAAAVAHGASVATHLFNAMPSVHHRVPGPVPLLLTDPGVEVELICDGVHVHPDVLAMAIRAARPSRVALVTDAMVAAGMPDGEYRIGELHVRVTDAVARLLEPDGTLGSIAGSTLTMAAALSYLVGTVGVGLADAAAMASTTPARWHGLAGRGVLAVGARADLVVVDEKATLRRVMYGGRWLEEGWAR